MRAVILWNAYTPSKIVYDVSLSSALDQETLLRSWFIEPSARHFYDLIFGRSGYGLSLLDVDVDRIAFYSISSDLLLTLRLRDLGLFVRDGTASGLLRWRFCVGKAVRRL